MSLPFKLITYFSTPFSLSTADDEVDTYVSDGSTLTYTLLKKTGVRLADTIQAGNTFYRAGMGQFTVLGDTFTLNSAPTVGTIIIAPGINSIPCRAYDQPVVEGIGTPQVAAFPFYIAPEMPTNIIQLYQYTSLPTVGGIRLELLDLDGANGAAPSWYQWAPSDPDGTMGALVSAATPILTGDISAYDQLTSGVSVGNTTLPVTNGAQFVSILGDYLLLDPGTAQEEQVKVLSRASNNLTTTACAFNHSAGAFLFDFGRKFWLQTQFPTNASSGTPTSLFDLVVNIAASAEAR